MACGPVAPVGLADATRRVSAASMADAVVIGAGPNGLVAANVLADAGWEVLVLEAQPEPGGAVRSAPLTLPGFTHDRFSAFYPLGVGSPHIAPPAARGARAALARGARGRRRPARGRHGGDPLARPRGDLRLRRRRRAGRRRRLARADRAWWDGVGPRFMAALLDPFPPVRTGRPARARPRRPARRARLRALRPALRCAASRPSASAATRPRGCSPATRCTPTSAPDTPGGALFGMVLVGLGQQLGWPVPEGGAGRLTDALVARLRSTGRPRRVRRARGADPGARRPRRRRAHRRTAARPEARRAVLADTGAPQLYLDLLDREHVPGARARRGSGASSTTRGR